MNYSYDYTELIEELNADLEERLITNDTILRIIRDEKIAYENYRPIIDYFYPDKIPNEDYENMTTDEVLTEMNQHNQVISQNAINEVLTIKEAVELWNLKDVNTLRQRFVRNTSFEIGVDCRQSGSTWLVTKESMERIYGKMKKD